MFGRGEVRKIEKGERAESLLFGSKEK